MLYKSPCLFPNSLFAVSRHWVSNLSILCCFTLTLHAKGYSSLVWGFLSKRACNTWCETVFSTKKRCVAALADSHVLSHCLCLPFFLSSFPSSSRHSTVCSSLSLYLVRWLTLSVSSFSLPSCCHFSLLCGTMFCWMYDLVTKALGGRIIPNEPLVVVSIHLVKSKAPEAPQTVKMFP